MKQHFSKLDFLRGFAALAVVLYHYGALLLPSIKTNFFSEFFRYGQYGVQIFFVISGFIIPYSMMKSNYKIGGFFRNLLRRFVRIAPAAYITLFFFIGIYLFTILFLKQPIEAIQLKDFSLTTIVGNTFFIAPYVGSPWFIPVFWTLAIEFQFYILIGVLLPLFLLRNKTILSILLVGIVSLGFVEIDGLGWYSWFFIHSSFFMLGCIAFFFKEKLYPKSLLLVLTAITLIFTYFQSGQERLIVGFLTFALIILPFTFDFKIGNYLGKISYSLYITHWPIGVFSELLLNRMMNFHEYPIGKIFMLGFYMIIAVMFSSLFYKWIEKPSIAWSKKIRINRH